jgi:hypothetical protein
MILENIGKPYDGKDLCNKTFFLKFMLLRDKLVCLILPL